MKVPYLTFFASRSTMTLWRKSSVSRSSQAPASTRVCSISTPGITGKVGKWSARYSSPSVRFLTARKRPARLHLHDPVHEVEAHRRSPDA